MSCYTTLIHTISGVSATTTGAEIDIRSAKRITFWAKSTGTAALSVEVSPNYVTSLTNTNETAIWVAYNKLITNVTNTNAQTPVRAASISVNATDEFCTMDLEGGDVFEAIKVTMTESVDGTHNAWVVIQY